ncbi:hypothetical protein ABW19_dt0200814 [Dactylella cylindrospora]|nr:hypothetical protein ABW19_dt0200814 [Dactylella cylindrospora]
MPSYCSVSLPTRRATEMSSTLERYKATSGSAPPSRFPSLLHHRKTFAQRAASASTSFSFFSFFSFQSSILETAVPSRLAKYFGLSSILIPFTLLGISSLAFQRSN